MLFSPEALPSTLFPHKADTVVLETAVRASCSIFIVKPRSPPEMVLKLRLRKKLMLLLFGGCCFFVIWGRMTEDKTEKDGIEWTPQHLASEIKTNITILLWYWPFGIPYSLSEDTCQKKHGISGCRLVDNHTQYSMADVVVFHHFELKTGIQKLPLHLPRPEYQRWLWMSLEAPQSNGNLSRYAGIFNLTLSYHPGADVTVPYGKIQKKDGNAESEVFVIPKNKTHLVCWVVSNYNNHHKRTSVYEELLKLIPVQVYGRAVKKPLSQDALLPTISRCYFYLAFENSVYPHYITEKLWRNAFTAGTVPVVLGPPRSHYEAVAPPHSFIHVNDFDSIATLAKFLKDIAGDENRYRSYFSWRKTYSVKLYDDWRDRLCNICQVYGQLPSHKIYHTLEA
ncbi:alpha-1,3-fucosyltransferase [Silurus asotus]|uniref:Fucosyltransferase n=1 Tax=Silurus asotus TaxID=30991 RepID=A0AAD5FEU8_SILAS|nr:alpha-1,3-fucosyltransferase [Silurus asotus]